jgi:hypothetical protein
MLVGGLNPTLYATDYDVIAVSYSGTFSKAYSDAMTQFFHSGITIQQNQTKHYVPRHSHTHKAHTSTIV